MSVLKKVLIVKRVKEQQALLELAHVNSVATQEKEKLGHLDDFLFEYTVEKTLGGRPIRRDELVNQSRFIGTIVAAQHLQHEKISKLSGIHQNKIGELSRSRSEMNVLEGRLSEIQLEQRKLKQQKEDALSAELFSNRKFYD